MTTKNVRSHVQQSVYVYARQTGEGNPFRKRVIIIMPANDSSGGGRGFEQSRIIPRPFEPCQKKKKKRIGSCDPIMPGRLTSLLWCNVTECVWGVVAVVVVVVVVGRRLVSYYSRKTRNRFDNIFFYFIFGFFRIISSRCPLQCL